MLTLARLGLLCALCVCAAAPAHADADGVDALLSRLAQIPGLSAKFHEEKRIQLLSTPLASDGSVYFTKPATLMRRVDTPESSRMLLAQGRLTLWDASGKHSFELGANAALRSLAESFLYVLAGDRKALNGLYDMQFSGSSAAAWKLRLSPKTKALARLIREIKLEGDALRVRILQLTEASGDVTNTSFSDVRTDRRFSAQEKQQIFGASAGSP